MDKICVGRIMMPFFPMRPVAGLSIRTPEVVSMVIQDLDDPSVVIEPKLNGDRAVVGVTPNGVYITNRHGSEYSFSVNNVSELRRLPVDTILDGEVWQGSFYPFAAISIGGESLMFKTCRERQRVAKDVCRCIKQKFLFARPSKAWVRRGAANGPQWEGVVQKIDSAPYIMLGSATQESKTWVKRRWV
jgi:hypothetical protein